MTSNNQPPKLPPGSPRVAGTDRGIWGRSTLTLYGTPDNPQLFAETPMKGTSAFNIARDDLVRFFREGLTWLGENNGTPPLPAWRPANNGSGKRIWFLTRYSGNDDTSVPLADRYHYGANGNLVRYASYEAAQRAADKLNKQEGIQR